MEKRLIIAIVVVAVLFVFFFPFGSLISTGNPVKSLDGANLQVIDGGDIVGVTGGNETNETNSTCSDDCILPGLLLCYGDSGLLRTCGEYDSDSCLDWGNDTYCQYGCDIYGCRSSPVNQSQSCIDTDQGIDYYVQGTLTGYWNSTVKDYCWGDNQLTEFYCSGNNYASVYYSCSSENKTCVSGACVQSNITLIGIDYSTELISATDTSATLKVSTGNVSETKEINEGAWKNINGLQTYLTNAGESPLMLSAQIKQSFNLSFGLNKPSRVSLSFIADGRTDPYSFELISATDTSATIKVTDLRSQVTATKEVVEGDSKVFMNDLNVAVPYADETNLELSVIVIADPFYLNNVVSNETGCTYNSDCPIGYVCSSETNTCVVSNETSYCGDGVIDYPEQCDGGNFGVVTSCENLGFDAGVISCSSDCRFDVSGCYNNLINPPKTCKTLFCVFSDRIRNFF